MSDCRTCLLVTMLEECKKEKNNTIKMLRHQLAEKELKCIEKEKVEKLFKFNMN